MLNELELTNRRRKVSSFKGEEAYLSFYSEYDYLLRRPRERMTLLGTHLFTGGLELSETVARLPPTQSVGSEIQDRHEAQSTECSFSISGLLTQSIGDLDWISPYRTPIFCFIDFIDDSLMGQGLADNIHDAQGRLIQTLVVRNLRLLNKKLTGQDDNGVTFSMEFTGSRVERLNPTTMDLKSHEMTTPEPIYRGGSVPPYPLSRLGYGRSFGSAFGN